MKHQWVEGCEDNCGSCNLCCLAICKVCGLFEGALTTDCPGVRVPLQVSDLIYQGHMDFRDGGWVYKISPHSPVSWETVGYCKECGAKVFKRDRVETREVYECHECGHPHSLQELWDEVPYYIHKE